MPDGAEQMPLDAPRLEPERIGDVLRRPPFDVAQDEHLALSGREAVERAPDAPPLLGTEHLALGRAPGRGDAALVELVGHHPPAPPPARASAVSARVHR